MDARQPDRPLRTWKDPTIRRIGTFGAVMRGGSRPNPDPQSLMRKVANMG